MHYLKSMRNIFRQGGRARASLTLLLVLAVAVGGVFVYQKVFAAPGITIATGGTNISLDMSLSAPGADYTNLTNISIAESAGGEIGLGIHTFSLPAGFRFDPSAVFTLGANWSSGFSISGFPTISPDPGAQSFSFNVNALSNSGTPVVLNISGLRIQPTGTAPADGIITHSGATITGVNGSTSFGSVSSAPGVATHLKVTTDPGTINAGGTVNATVRAYDQFDNLVSSGPNNYTNSKNLTFYFNDSEIAAAHQSPNATNPTTGGSNLGVSIPVTFTNGVSATVTVVPVKMETVDVDVSDGTINSTSNIAYDAAITVTPGNFNTFVIGLAGTATAGTATTTRLYAYDSYGNTTNKDEDGSAFAINESVTFTTTATVAPDGTTKPTYNGLDMTGAGQAVTVDLTAGWFTSSDIIFYNAGETPTVTAQHGTKSAASGAIAIAHAATDHLKFSGAVGAQVAGVQFALPALNAVDAYGNLADGANGATAYTAAGVAVSYLLSGIANGPSAGSDVYATSVDFTNGASNALNTTLYHAQNTNVTANIAVLPNVVANSASNSFTVSAANAASLSLTTQPAGSVSGVTLTTQPVVTAKDAYGNIATNFVDIVTLTPSIGSLSNNAVAAVAGVATFTNTAHTATVDNQAVTMTADDVAGGVEGDLAASAASDEFNTNVIATHLAFTQQPLAGVNSDAVLGTQPTVTAQGPNDVTDTDFVETVTLTISGGTLLGDVDIAAIAGAATFTDVAHRAVADNTAVHLIADDVVGGIEGDLTTVNSTDFTTLVVATKLLVTTQPASVISAISMTQPVVKFVDANDVVDADIGATDDVTISENGAGSITAGATTVTVSNGVVTFVGLVYSSVADQEAVTFTFTDNAGGSKDFSGAGIPSNALIADVVATKIVLTTPPALIVSGVSMTQPVLEYQNVQNIKDTGVNGDVITITENGSGSLTGATTAVATNGVTTFAGVIYSAVADQENVTLTFTDDAAGLDISASPVSSGVLTADVVATKIIFATSPSGCDSWVACTTQPIVRAVNAQDVLDVDFVTGTLTLTKQSGAGTLSNDGGATGFVGGVSTFAGVALTSSAADHEIYVLRATHSGALGFVDSANIDLNVIATKFVIINPTDGTVDAPIIVTIQAQNAANILDTDESRDVTLATNGAATGGGLVGIVNGVGTKAISNQTAQTVNLTLTDSEGTTLNVASAQDVIFGVGVAAKLAFTVQPSTPSQAGVAFGTQPSAIIQDQYGNTRTADTDTITLSAFTEASCTTPSTGTLAGTLTKAAVVGVADFTGNGVNHQKMETIYLKAATGSLQSACSNGVVITAGPYHHLLVNTENSLTESVDTVFDIILIPVDQYGNTTTGASPVNVDFATTAIQAPDGVTNPTFDVGVGNINMTTCVLGGGQCQIADVNLTGQVTVNTNIRLVKAGETPTISARDVTTGGTPSGTSNTITVNSGAASYLIVTGTAAMTTGSQNELTITAKDAYANTATSYTGAKNITFSGPIVAPLGTIPTVEETNVGAATSINFTNGVSDAGIATLIAYKAEVTTVDAADGGVNSAGNVAYDLDLTVNAGNLESFNLVNFSTLTAGTATTTVVTAWDAYHNVTTKDADSSALAVNESVAFASTAHAAPNATNPTYAGANLLDGETVIIDLSSGSFTTANIIFYKASEAPTLTITLDDKSGTATSAGVNSAAISALSITGDSPRTTAQTSTITVTGTDQYQNPVTDNGVVVTLAAGGGANLASGGGTLTTGLFTTTLTKDTPGSSTVTASSGALTPGNVTIVFTDGTAPTATINPANGSTGVSRTVNPVVTFSKAMTSGTMSAANIQLRKYSDDSAVAGTISTSTTQAVIIPSTSLDYNTKYYITLSNLTDDTINANALAGWDTTQAAKDSHQFTTEAAETTAPTVVSWAPADDATGVQTNAQIWIKFSEPITYTAGSIELRKYSDNTEVAVTRTLSESNTKITLTPTVGSLAYGTQYYFFIGTGVKDAVNNPFAADTWYQDQKAQHEFTTIPGMTVQVYAEKTDATINGGYFNGWRYRYEMTLNTTETTMEVAFPNGWLSSAVPPANIPTAENMKMLINESTGGQITGLWDEGLITGGQGNIKSYALNTTCPAQTPSASNINALDSNPDIAGRQIVFYVFTKIPAGTDAGIYTADYTICTD